jgi:dCTP deaminase
VAFWGNQRWDTANGEREIVTDFDLTLLSDGAYKLSIGNEVIVSSGYAEEKGSYRSLSKNATLPLEPGQFAYLITKERVTLPVRTIGFINVNTSTKIKGLINISGFHVDPGYNGKLIFTVFNASPSAITLHEGQRIFRLWISDFDGEGGQSKTSYDNLPLDLADRLHGTYPSPFALAARVNAIETSLTELKGQRHQIFVVLFVAAILLLPIHR